MSTPPPPTQYGESPGRTSVSVASSRASSIPMSYSMDSEGASLTQPPTSNIGGVGRDISSLLQCIWRAAKDMKDLEER